MTNRIIIDGREFVGARSVTIRNGTVTVDGQAQDGALSGVVEIKVEGVLERLETDASVTCRDVHGSISAGGSVSTTGNIDGNVSAGGSVKAGGRIAGAINAGGSVRIG